jgi:hypothetical protein
VGRIVDKEVKHMITVFVFVGEYDGNDFWQEFSEKCQTPPKKDKRSQIKSNRYLVLA